jgi:uncharacterized protein
MADGRRWTLPVYFILTFAAAWGGWLLAANIPSNPGSPARDLLFLPGTVAPGAVAITLAAVVGGRRGVAALLEPVTRWRVAPWYYLLAIGFLALAKLAAATFHLAWRGEWPAFGDTPLLLMLLAAAFSTPFQLGEELGWRGFALPAMANGIGLPASSIILGLVWAIWHLPLFYIPGTPNFGQSLPLYTLQVTALSVAFAWLYWRTGGSLLLVMLLHAAVNNTSGIVPAGRIVPANPWSADAPAVGWLTAAILWMAAVGFMLDMRRGVVQPNTDKQLPR